jgi:hypothetical protein
MIDVMQFHKLFGLRSLCRMLRLSALTVLSSRIIATMAVASDHGHVWQLGQRWSPPRLDA